MPSPVTDSDSDNPARLIGETGQATETASQGRPALVRWPWVVAALLVTASLLLTLAGALTSPPHVRGIPDGRLIFLEADEPSDHTTLLRGLRIMGPEGSSRQLLHEQEPQDVDAGSREWISQPTASPDGRWLAFEKQIITLQEEQQSIDNQLWVMPLTSSGPQPRMLLDLTPQKLKQFIGLTWTPDSRAVVFLNDATVCTVALSDGKLQKQPLTLKAGTPATSSSTISTTRDPFLLPTGRVVAGYSQDGHQQFLNAFNPSRGQTATLIAAAGRSAKIQILGTAQPPRVLTGRWGWSVFGGRRITALKWSPDGKYLAYSVSKPPFEDELFYIDLATGKCFQLPVRTGRDGWDWAR